MKRLEDIGVAPYEAFEPEVVESSWLAKIRSLLWFLYKVNLSLLFSVVNVLDGLFRLVWPVEKKKLSGQLALVTGGANGLGRQISLRLAKERCRLAICDLDLKNAEATADEIRKTFNVDATAYKLDVANYEEIEAVKEAIESDLGHVEILVNNAGLLSDLSLRDGKPSDIKRTVDVNLLSLLYMTRVFIEGMRQRGKGHIVSISSVFGIVPFSHGITYAATKFGVRGFMASLADELYLTGHGDKVHTLCVHPNFLRTRKQLMDSMRECGMDQWIDFYSPDYAADVIVNAMKEKKQMTAVPPHELSFYQAVS
jgi:short-subunit dehydrogenase